MGKTHIIAKVMLSCLGIYAVFRCASGLLGQNISEPSFLPRLLPLSIFVVIAFFAIYFLIFNNDALARKIVGTVQAPENSFDQKAYLIKSYRLAFAFLALIFLSGIGYWLVSFIIDLPLSCIQLWTSDAVGTESLMEKMHLFTKIQLFFYNLLSMLVTIYLLCGAPHVIRWHLKHIPSTDNLKGSQDE